MSAQHTPVARFGLESIYVLRKTEDGSPWPSGTELYLGGDYAELIAQRDALLAALKDVVCHAASEVSHCAGQKCRESHCADCMGEESAERYIAEVAISVEAARAAIAKVEGDAA